jgi:exopolysaccharide biosynthesis protein
MGVGYNSAGKLLMVYCAKAVTFEKFAAIMKGLGCVEAMNLDGGASLAMWYGGKTLVKPGRRLTNLLVLERR